MKGSFIAFFGNIGCQMTKTPWSSIIGSWLYPVQKDIDNNARKPYRMKPRDFKP
jgi:hypothetical protein